jgi:DHA3 family tetracycline resistance protein-like MFS transporter
MTIARAFGYRLFALVWAGQTASRLGDHLYEIALAWWVLEKTGSAAIMGTVLIFSFAPMLVFLLLGGVAGDRFPRARVMLASDLGRGVVVTVVAVLALADRLEVPHVLVASLLFGLADAFFQPAYAAIVPELAPEEALPSANSLTSLGVQGGRILGRALGAALVSAGGTPLAFAVNGLSFFIAAACVVPLALAGAAPRGGSDAPTSVVADLREGLAAVLSVPWLWATIAVIAVTNVTLSGPYMVALPFLVKDDRHAAVGLLGLLYATFAAGYVVGAAWLGRFTHLRRRGLLIYGGLLGAGLGMLVVGLPVPPPLVLLAALVNGAALQVASLAWISTRSRTACRWRSSAASRALTRWAPTRSCPSASG